MHGRIGCWLRCGLVVDWIGLDGGLKWLFVLTNPLTALDFGSPHYGASLFGSIVGSEGVNSAIRCRVS